MPLFPLSPEAGHLGRLRRGLAVYRLAFGQPRQEDLVGFLVEQADDGNGGPSDLDRVAIEVYPALAKNPSNDDRVLRDIARFLPEDPDPDPDDYDAAICALHAIQFGAGNEVEGLPPLIPPDLDSEEVKEEGWIYHFAPGKR